MSKNYYFLNKEKLRAKSKTTTKRIEEMYNAFNLFLDLLKTLREDPYIDFTYLEGRAGITPKILDKLSDCIEDYRRLYFERITDIFQTSIEDFTDSLVEKKVVRKAKETLELQPDI